MQKEFTKDTQLQLLSGSWAVPTESRIDTFCRNDIIAPRPASFWLLQRGAIKTWTWSEAGTVTVLGYWGAGDVLG